MSTAKEEITVKASLPPGPVNLPEDTSPVKSGEPVIMQGEQRATPVPTSSLMTPEERAKRKAMIVTTLDRGVINDRMSIDLPPHLHGEWVRRDPFEIEQMKRLGFRLDTEYATQRSLNTDGTGAAMVIDVVYMITEKANKELIDEVKRDKFLEVHSKKGKDKEEKDFAAGTRQETGGVIPTDLDSKTREARREDISAALEAMNTQTQPQRP